MTLSISVFGTGYLGAVHAAALAQCGHRVIGVDVDPDRIAQLSAGRPPFHEPEFDSLLAEALASGRLTFITDPRHAAAADVHFICVGTPQSAVDGGADLTHVWSVARTLASIARTDSVIVGKSTVPVGTAAQLSQFLTAELGTRAPSLVWNPEFLREGFAVQDSLNPDRIVVGLLPGNLRSAEVLREVYFAQLESNVPYLEVSRETAELVKVAANSFLAMKISFINALAEVCESADADVVDLADALGMDSRIGRRFLNAGLGFGGGCLPKDIRAFAARAEEMDHGEAVSFLRWADAVNLRCRSRIVDLAEHACGGTVLGRRVTVLGAAFKPDSDDVRDSPGLEVAKRLSGLGAVVTLHDPQARPTLSDDDGSVGFVSDLVAALTSADLLILATEWQQYRQLDPDVVATLVDRPVVIDGRNALDHVAWQSSGWRVYAPGRPRAAPAGDRVIDLARGTGNALAPTRELFSPREATDVH